MCVKNWPRNCFIPPEELTSAIGLGKWDARIFEGKLARARKYASTIKE